MRRILTLMFVGLTSVFLVGCQVNTTVDIKAAANGTGSVTVRCDLDASAQAAAPNLADELNDSDLQEAGWIISGPSKQSNGDAVYTVKHNFGSIAVANQLLTQLTGAQGPFKNFKLTQTRSLTNVKTQFEGSADLSNGVESFGNPLLTQKFGNPLGFNVAQYQSSTGLDLNNTFPINIELNTPGSTKTVTPAFDSNNTWNLHYGKVNTLLAASDGANVKTITYASITVGLVLLAIIVALVWRVYKPQHREGHGVSATDLIAQMKSDDTNDDRIEAAGFDFSRVVYDDDHLPRTADTVALHQFDGKWKVLLITRGGEPFKGRLAAPGGFMEAGTDSNPGSAAARELREETGLIVLEPDASNVESRGPKPLPNQLAWLGVWNTPGRDPRFDTRTDTYVVVLPEHRDVVGGDDAAKAEWVDLQPLLNKIETGEKVLAFDHDDYMKVVAAWLQQVYEPEA